MNIFHFLTEYIDPEEKDDWLFGIALSVFAYLLIYVLLKLPGKNRRKKYDKWWFILINTLLLTSFTIGCSREIPLLLETQADIFSGLFRIQSLLHQNLPQTRFLGTNRFLLVDVSHDLTLVRDSSFNESWQANQLVTDRKKLTRLLDLLASENVDSLLDMVVRDLTFGDASDAGTDKALQAAFDKINSRGKLLIAKTSQIGRTSIYGHPAIATESLAGGSVDVTKYYDGVFFEHQLFEPVAGGNYRFGLPYELYRKLEQVDTAKSVINLPLWQGMLERKAGSWPALVPREFVPEFWVNNADMERLSSQIEGSDTINSRTVPGSKGKLQPVNGRFRSVLYYLGQLADTTAYAGGEEMFVDQLRSNRQEGNRSTVFIGLFEDDERDMHQTLIGPMHGSVLLLNLVINLINGSHRINLLYIVYLLTGFACVSYLLLIPDLRVKKVKPIVKKRRWAAFIDMLIEDLNGIMNWIIDKRAYLVAFALLIGAIILFNHLINMAVIGLYLALQKRIIGKLYYNKDNC